MWQLGSQTLDKAVTVKLTRTLAIIPITLFGALSLARRKGGGQAEGFSIKQALPKFIVLIACASLPTTIAGAFGVEASTFAPLKELGKFFITMAMAGVVMNADFVKLVKTGAKPLGLGLACWIGIACSSLIAQHALGIW